MTCVAALAALTVGASTAQAQAGAQFSLSGGVAIPTSSAFNDAFKLGWNGQLGIGFTPANLPIGFEATGNFIRNSTETSGLDLKSQIISGTGNIVYTFTTAESSKFHPYLLGGAGVYNAKATGNDATGGSRTKFGLDGGAGFNFGVGRIGAFLEGRFHNIFKAIASTDGTGDTSINFVTVNLGFRFGTGSSGTSGM
ncbi:MAG TPA: outer membrane beta-barrel protein [Gemmatimonadales bacterium]|nr:outer membrane beta-barrel protein [Gemmatimonadales bacterium]